MASPDSVNDQITDAVQQVSALLPGSARSFYAAVEFLTVSHAVSLAIHNAVSQQQHRYTLANAITSAAAAALLKGQRDEAEAALKLADAHLGNRRLAEEIEELRAILKSAVAEFQKTGPAAGAAGAPGEAR